MDETPSRTGSNRLFALFANPWVGIVGSVASIFGVLLAVYFYLQTYSSPELVYYVNPARAVVVKQGTASRLTVLFDGRPLTQDLTATQVAIWNRGRQAIRRAAILQPIIIRTEPRVPILEATVRRTSREVVSLDLDRTRLADGEVSVSWNILEQGDGAALQLVYAAGPDAQIQCLGVVEGQASIRELRYRGTIKSPAEQMREGRLVRYVLGLFVVCALVSLAGSLWELRRSRDLTSYSFAALGMVLFVGMILFVVYMFFMYAIPEPPFGF